jgi:hypothetical protein
MESSVSFEKIVEAFMHASEYSVLLKNSLLKIHAPTKEQVLELKEKGVFLIPKKSAEFEKKLKEEFTYEIKDAKLAEKYFESAIHAGHEAFSSFISSNGLTHTWAEHEKKYTKNALINWMTKSGIELPDQKLIPDITLSEVEPMAVPDEMKSFAPVKCNSCHETSGFIVKYYKTSQNCENLLMEKQAGKLIAEQGFLHFHFLGTAKKDLIATSRCHRCNSSELEWDFT